MGRRSALATPQPPPPPEAEPEGDAVDLSSVVDPDLGVVDLLARATLEAQRRGETLPCRGASPELLWLVRLCGLDEFLRLEGGSGDKGGI